jgi:hypothetical protein
METRKCTTCNEFKPSTNEFFSLNKKGKDGLNYKCKICAYAYTKQWLKSPSGRKSFSNYVKSDKGKSSVTKSQNKLGAGIYEITNLITGDNYIGQSTHLTKRKHEHFSQTKENYYSNQKLFEAMNLYSQDVFSFTVIESLPIDKKLLLKREQYYINKLKPTYNIV